MIAAQSCPRCGGPFERVTGHPPVCDTCWAGLPSRLRRAVARRPVDAQAAWAAGLAEIQPAPRKKRPSRRQRPRAQEAPERLTFLSEVPPPPVPAPQPPVPAPEAPAIAAPPITLRREQARVRRAALIAEQLGDRDLPLYFVDFMNVEDLARGIGFEGAVRTVARREGRSEADVEEAWHEAVARIASDDRCRYVDALRPYLERIDAESGVADEA